MQFTAKTIALEGVKARLVDVQCQLSRGPHSFQIVGLPGAAVREARERIMAAFYAHSLSLPPMRITLNLSPADLPKSGSHYDLPMAIALLVNMELLPKEEIEASISLGELALDGRVEPVCGVLSAGLEADAEHTTLICPQSNAHEAMLLPDLKLIAPAKLLDLIQHFRGRPIELPKTHAPEASPIQYRDLSEIKGLEQQKRAIEIAAAGRHHLFMVGPPGTGKSMLASSVPSIMPPMTSNEILESVAIHSAAGPLQNTLSIGARPYLDPHHTASAAAIVGGGRDAKPGAISLAHHGVLFMDELPEFKRDVLESLRQPLESSKILVSRANAHYVYPAKFLLIAAANPCPCGWMFDAEKWCSRAPICGQRYMEKLSGPLLDRFSLRVAVQELSIDAIRDTKPAERSAKVKARVVAARARAYARNGEGVCNEDLSTNALDAALENAPSNCATLAQRAMQRFSLSTRGYYRLIKTALTISDLAEANSLHEDHIYEAVTYRLLEQEPWNYDASKTLKAVRQPAP